MIKRATKAWIRNAADEKAVAAGAYFDNERADHACEWIESYCYLYEGNHSGELMRLVDWQLEVTQRMFGWVIDDEEIGRTVRRFRKASLWVPKKNKKSPTLAAWGLYLFCGDGEQGQKVFTGARDGKQALIAHTHAMMMVKQSPELQAECKIHATTSQISHEASFSTYKILAADNHRSAEGLNGSLIIDETHVVDNRLAEIIADAGASRDEPLQIEASTVGNDPGSYGRKRYEYGKNVNDGNYEDHEFLFVFYGAPQDITDDEIHRDPVKVGKVANPAWGHTIREREFLASYNRARKSITDFAGWKQRRLNIWQSSKNPWLKADDWASCSETFGLDRFEGDLCWLGFDKSKTRDMTSIVAWFTEDGESFYQWPMFWLPEATAENHKHDAPFLDWAESGHLELIPGQVITNAPITEWVASLAETHRIAGVWYDRTYAEDITVEWFEELGIERIEFPQTTQQFAGPIEDYERLVIQGLAKHPNHPVLNWQAGHCEVHQDSKGRKTLVKPKHSSVKKIDGMVAGVMGLFGALAESGAAGSFYEDEELEEV